MTRKVKLVGGPRDGVELSTECSRIECPYGYPPFKIAVYIQSTGNPSEFLYAGDKDD